MLISLFSRPKSYLSLNKRRGYGKDVDKSLAFMFTGQGSQFIGMGKEIYKSHKVARDVYEEIDESLRFPLTNLILNGCTVDLNMTENTQPALLAYSIALVKTLESIYGGHVIEKGRFILGHSIGEICALAAIRSISIPDAAMLCRFRGHQMQISIPRGMNPSMVALYPIKEEQAMELVKLAEEQTGEPIDIGNINSPLQIVISGSTEGVDAVIDLGKKRGSFRKSTVLQVSAPFHSRIMKPAEEAVAKYLLDKDIVKRPAIDMVSNLTGCPVSKPNDIINSLIKSISKPVRFNDCVTYSANKGCTDFIEIGPRKTLCPFVLQNNDKLKAHFVSSSNDIEDLLRLLD